MSLSPPPHAPHAPDELQRYHRHLILPEVGEAGQRRLKSASALLVGAGGLGSPAALYLAAAGVGHIGIVDAHAVELSNLQRQLLHDTAAVGMPRSHRPRRGCARSTRTWTSSRMTYGSRARTR